MSGSIYGLITHDSKQGRGGWREVASIQERDAIDPNMVRNGMIVVQTDSDLVWYRKKGNWVELNLFNFATLDEIEQLIRDILQQNGTGPISGLVVFRTENGIAWTTESGQPFETEASRS